MTLRIREDAVLVDRPASGRYSSRVASCLVGEAVQLAVRWVDPATGESVTPRKAELRLRGPSGSVGPLAAETAAGVSRATFTPDAPGQWWYGFEASGGWRGYAEHLIVARARRL